MRKAEEQKGGVLVCTVLVCTVYCVGVFCVVVYCVGVYCVGVFVLREYPAILAQDRSFPAVVHKTPCCCAFISLVSNVFHSVVHYTP